MQLQLPSILITDDDTSFRETLQSIFEPEGYRTLLAADGTEAIDILQVEEVHLVVLDMHMPQLTGLEVVQLLRQVGALLPCIMLSADWDEQLRGEAASADVFATLSKPVTRREIISEVQSALQQTYNWPN